MLFACRRCLICLLFPILLLPAGCSSDLHYIFNGSADSRGLPLAVGLDYEEVWFPASDGQLLHGWYIPGQSAGPLLFYCHGNAANISYRLDILDYFNTRLGLPVFIFDYRGFGQSTGAAKTEADLYKDARGALAYLAGRGWTPQRMVYYGRSLGSAVALQMALERPPAGLVLESVFTSLRGVAFHLRPVTYLLLGSWLLGHAYDNLAKIDRLQVPLLIIQGGADPIVPPKMSAELFARARPPKRRVVIPGAGHSNCYQVGGTRYLDAWEEFLQSLGAIPAPP